MIKNLSTKINILTVKSKLLIIGYVDNKLLESLSSQFKTVEFLEDIQNSRDIINNTLYDQFDAIVFSFDKKLYGEFKNNGLKILNKAVYIVSEDLYLDFKDHINDIFALLVNPNEDRLLEKIYFLLCEKETANILKTKEKIENKYKNDAVNEDIDIFLDQYSGNIMFINDDLNESLERLNDLEISKELFKNISLSLINLSDIFKENSKLQNTSILLREFSSFLDNISLEDIDPSRFDAFDYLTNIIEDLTLYIDELFVYRLFKDVAIFEDSMQNNISYFETKLLGIEDEDENLEFF